VAHPETEAYRPPARATPTRALTGVARRLLWAQCHRLGCRRWCPADRVGSRACDVLTHTLLVDHLIWLRAESEEIERAGGALIEAAPAPARVILFGSRVGGTVADGFGACVRPCVDEHIRAVRRPSCRYR
jgi:hypothetical protein